MDPEAATLAAPPATTAATPAETTPTGEGTASAKPGAQQDPAAANATATPELSEPNPTDAAIAASRKADANRMALRLGIEGDFESIDAVEDALADAEEEAREAALAEQANNKYGDRVRNLISKAKAIKLAGFGEDGEASEIGLADSHIQPLIDELNGLRQDIVGIERQASYDVLASAVLDIIPEEEHHLFLADVEAGLGIDAWMRKALERAAPHSQWAKTNALDNDAAEKRGYDKGFTDGAAGPKGQASQANSTSKPPVTGDGKTVPERASLLASGELNFAAEMNRVLGRT